MLQYFAIYYGAVISSFAYLMINNYYEEKYRNMPKEIELSILYKKIDSDKRGYNKRNIAR